MAGRREKSRAGAVAPAAGLGYNGHVHETDCPAAERMKAMTKIPDTMQALVAYGANDYRLERVPVPKPGPGEMLIRVEACGICAGDIKARLGARRFWGDEQTPAYVEPPCTPGHEVVGRVVALGEGVEGFSPGDRVTSEQIVPCGHCRFCRTGRYWLCVPHRVYGFKFDLNGGMAEYMLLPRGSRNFKVPDALPLEAAALIEPFSCSKHAVDRAAPTYDDVVVLSGAGTLGLGMVGALRMKNPRLLIVLDMLDSRLELARAFGADLVLNPSRDDVEARVMDLTGGYGCDIYIEATGHAASVMQGLRLIRKAGRFIEFSVFKDAATVDWSIIGDEKELEILGASLSPYCFPAVIEWLDAGKLPYQGVVTHRFPLSQWKEAFAAAADTAHSIKVVITPE